MYTLRAIMCVMFLCCGLECVVPDNSPDRQTMSSRDQKLKELLRTLDAYTTDIGVISSTTNKPFVISTTPDSSLSSTTPVFPDFTDTKVRSKADIRDDFPEGPEIKSYQDFYRTFYGTQEGVNFLRKKYGPNGLQKARAKYGVNRNLDDVKLANAHFLKIRNRAKCQKPVPQVIRVKDYYPDPSREYVPRCTILHRCGDDTGCCDSDLFHCAPSSVQEVTLHFYTITVGKHGIDYGGNIEKLLFVNHTACQCQLINDLPRIQDGTDAAIEEDILSKSKCSECPVPFTSRIYKDGRCGCDCFDKQKPCIRIKRGREPLPEIERRCVEAHHCHIPDCEYGLYDHRTGFCPKRHDEEQRVPHRKTHHGSPSQRWAFLERD